MKKIVFFVVILFTTITFAQQKKATRNASGDLIGISAKSDFEQQPYASWFTPNFNNYTINEATAKKLKKALKGVKIKAFMGTWCGTSKRSTPQFYKLLELAHFDLKNLEIIALNRGKRTPDNLQKDYNIIKVPTYIFYKKGKEIGRFVEYPRQSLDKDILKLLTTKEYKHSYDHSK